MREQLSGLSSISRDNMTATIAPSHLSDRRTILSIAIWFAVLAGLVEGIGLWALQLAGWLTGAAMYLGPAPDIIWISVIFDLAFFLLIGLILLIVGIVFPRLFVTRVSIYVYTFLLIFDWVVLILIERVHLIAILVLSAGLTFQAARQLIKNQEKWVRFWRKSLPWSIAVAILVVVGIRGGMWLREKIATEQLPAAAPGSPNILVIVIDTLRSDHLSVNGYARNTSPAIDRIAGQGVLFENAFSTSSWTKPAHASLLTGLFVSQHLADNKPLDNRFPTIGEVLQTYGYRTGGFSGNFDVFGQKEHLDRGFMHFEGHYQSLKDDVTSSIYGFLFEDEILHKAIGYPYKLNRKLAPEINQGVLRWIDSEPGKPFFAFLNYFDVHAPYIPPQPYRSKFSNQANPGGQINTDWDLNHIYIPLTPEQLQGEMDAYDGAISYVDDNIQQLFDQLQARGILNNTLVVIVSDHGESFGEHGLREHTNSLYREVVQVPLIFWWPGHIPQGQRIAQPVTIAALPATLIDLIGQAKQNKFQGPALTALWTQPEASAGWPDPIAEIGQKWWVPPQHLTSKNGFRSTINSQWQYIEQGTTSTEIYAYKQDPQETKNLATNPEMQPVMAQFKSYLQKFLTSTFKIPGSK